MDLYSGLASEFTILRIQWNMFHSELDKISLYVSIDKMRIICLELNLAKKEI